MNETTKQSIRDQATGTCTHYFGLGSQARQCALGVNIRALVGGSDFAWVLRIPCVITKQATTEDIAICDSFVPMSKEAIEQIIAEAEEREKISVVFATWFKSIRETAERGKVYVDICPICGRAIRYAICKAGHAAAKCLTENCINFME